MPNCPLCTNEMTALDEEYFGHCGACESGLCDVQDDRRPISEENEPEKEEEDESTSVSI